MFTLENGLQVSDIPDNYTGWFIDEYGSKFRYQHGKLHRVDGPAIEWADGIKEWYQQGKRHRLDGPAIEWVYGSKSWYQQGNLHRINGPAWEGIDGTKEWLINGKQITKLTRLVLVCLH